MGDGASEAQNSLDSRRLSFHDGDDGWFVRPDMGVVGYPGDLGCMPRPEIAGQRFPVAIHDPVPDEDDPRDPALVRKPAELPSDSHAVVRRVGHDQCNREPPGDCTPEVLQSGGRVEDHDFPRKVTRVSQYCREEGVLRAEAP